MRHQAQSLAVEDMRLGYGRATVVHDASLRIESGKVLALVGPNGSGKSTLLRGMARLHAAETGALQLIAGEDEATDCATLCPREFATRLAMLTQQRPTPAGMTVRQVVGLGRHPHRSRWLGSDAEGPAAVAHALALTGAPTWPTVPSTSCRAVRCNASGWPAAWPSRPRCCCSTSRPTISTCGSSPSCST